MERRESGFRWLVLFLFVLGAAVLNFSNMVFASRPVEVMAQFNMDQAQLTAISSIGVLPGAFFSILLGNYFDKHGAKSILYVGTLLLLLAAAFQLWRVFADSFVQLFLITFIAGTFFLPTQVLPAKMIGIWFSRKDIAAAMGVYGAAAGIGITLAFFLGTVFPTITMALLTCAAGFFIVAILWFFWAKVPSGYDEAQTSDRSKEVAGAPKVSVKAVVKSKSMWFVMICGGLAAGVPLLLNSYMINAFLARELPSASASILGIFFNIFLVIGGILAGFIVSKSGRYNIPYLILCLGGAVFIFMAFLVPAGIATFVCIALGGLFSAGSLGVNMARISVLHLTGEFGPENVGIAGGMNNTAMGICMFVLPTIAAVIFGNNYLAVFITIAALYALMAVVGGIMMPELGEKGELAKKAREAEKE